MTGQTCRSWVTLAACTLLLPGCLSAFNPVAAPAPEVRQTCDSLPLPSRNRVHVVLVNGVDPLCCGNLHGVREQIVELGFGRTYYAQFYHEASLFKELQAAHARDPHAKIAIVGFEYGAQAARNLARRASEQGITTDLLLLLQPKGLRYDPALEGGDIRRHITIRTGKDELTNLGLETGEIFDLPCFNRYGVPTHPNTLRILTTELTHLAMNVPVIDPVVTPFPSMLDDPAPSPRPITISDGKTHDEWDFLKPVSRRKPTRESAPPLTLIDPVKILPTTEGDFPDVPAVLPN